MSFTRGTRGRNAYHIFYDVDVIAYVEGDDDVSFWKTIIKAYDGAEFLPKMKFKPQGGKLPLLGFADEIIDGSITKSLVFMDRDYDDFLGLMKQHPAIIYTYGYSWENDVLSLSALIEYIQLISKADADHSRTNEELESFLTAHVNSGEKLLKLDIPATYHGSPIQNKQNKTELTIVTDQELKFCPKKITEKVAIVNCEPTFTPLCSDFLSEFHGHTLIWIFYNQAIYIAKKFGRVIGTSLDLFVSYLLQNCHKNLEENSERSGYYEVKCSNIFEFIGE
ncbi:MAG: DUF4435 domain-containing protein [Hyphomicrobiales bacterium]